jgi:protein gp37
MSDVFHESVSVDDIAKIFAVMYLANWHTFQVLTKRAERMKTILNDPLFYGRVLMAAETLRAANKNLSAVPIPDPSQFPSTHIWLGVSVENQSAAEV